MTTAVQGLLFTDQDLTPAAPVEHDPVSFSLVDAHGNIADHGLLVAGPCRACGEQWPCPTRLDAYYHRTPSVGEAA